MKLLKLFANLNYNFNKWISTFFYISICFDLSNVSRYKCINYLLLFSSFNIEFLFSIVLHFLLKINIDFLNRWKIQINKTYSRRVVKKGAKICNDSRYKRFNSSAEMFERLQWNNHGFTIVLFPPNNYFIFLLIDGLLKDLPNGNSVKKIYRTVLRLKW